MSEAVTTTDHEEIRRWVEDRGGRPSRVKTAQPGGILRIDFGEAEEELEEIGWDRFFEIFESNDLSFLYQQKTSGGDESRFNKFIERDD